MILGELMKKYLDEHSLTYDAFSHKAGITKGYVSMLIKNVNNRTGRPPVPSITTYQKIAESMNMTLDDLFRTIDDAPVRLSENDENNTTDENADTQATTPQRRKWRMISAGTLTMSDEELDRFYQVARAMHPEKFPPVE